MQGQGGCWVLWFFDTLGQENLLGAYPSWEEAHQAEVEEFSSPRRAFERFTIQEYSAKQLLSLG
jgi:hypothetical protein